MSQLSQSTLDLSSMSDSYTNTSQSFRGSQTNLNTTSSSMRKHMSTESLLDRIPAASHVTEPRVSNSARKSLESLTRSNSTLTIEDFWDALYVEWLLIESINPIWILNVQICTSHDF